MYVYFFSKKFPPVFSLLEPVRLFILLIFFPLYDYSLLYNYWFWPHFPIFFDNIYALCTHEALLCPKMLMFDYSFNILANVSERFVYDNRTFQKMKKLLSSLTKVILPVRFLPPVRLLILALISRLYVYYLLYYY